MSLIDAPTAAAPRARGVKAVLCCAAALVVLAYYVRARSAAPTVALPPSKAVVTTGFVAAHGGISSMTCPELEAAVGEQGFEKVAGGIVKTQTHPFGQVMGKVLLEQYPDLVGIRPRMRELARWALSNYTVHAAFAFGYIHGSVWYILGVRPDFGWQHIQTELCSIATYEFLSVCVHAVGHAGFVRQAAPFDRCDSIVTIDATRLQDSYALCAAAPSTFLEMMCANGYYHGITEELDPEASGVHWLYPCNTLELPFPELCFKWLFETLPLTLFPGNPFRGFDVRRYKLEAEGGLDLCTTSGLPERLLLACVWGMSSLVFPAFWSHAVPELPEVADGLPNGGQASLTAYYLRSAPPARVAPIAASAAPLVEWCASFLEARPTADRPAGPLSPIDARRWLTCVSGALEFTFSQVCRTNKVPYARRALVCAQLIAVPWLTPKMRRVSHDLCMARVGFGYVTFMPKGEVAGDEVDVYGAWSQSWEHSSWDDWTTASVKEERFAMWPLYNFSYAAVEEVPP